jgi:hypothetical protein
MGTVPCRDEHKACLRDSGDDIIPKPERRVLLGGALSTRFTWGLAPGGRGEYQARDDFARSGALVRHAELQGVIRPSQIRNTV